MHYADSTSGKNFLSTENLFSRLEVSRHLESFMYGCNST